MTTNNTLTQTCSSTAKEIMELLDVLGFTSNEPHDNVQTLIADIIRRHIESNPLSVLIDGQFIPSSTLINEMIEEIEGEELPTKPILTDLPSSNDDVPF